MSSRHVKGLNAEECLYKLYKLLIFVYMCMLKALKALVDKMC